MSSDCWRYIYLSPNSPAIQRPNLPVATLHIVPLVAFCDLKSKVRDMTASDVSEVSLLFRTPAGELLYLSRFFPVTDWLQWIRALRRQ